MSRSSILVTDDYITIPIISISMHSIRITRTADGSSAGGGDLTEGVTDYNVLMVEGAAGPLSR